MKKSELQQEQEKTFFLSLIENEDWQDLFSWADNKQRHNGTDGLIRYKPHNILITSELDTFFIENDCIWFRNLILDILSSLNIDKDFQVWYLLVNNENEATIICDNGNFEPMLYFKIPYTDFKQTQFDALKIYFENNTLYFPSQR